MAASQRLRQAGLMAMTLRPHLSELGERIMCYGSDGSKSCQLSTQDSYEPTRTPESAGGGVLPRQNKQTDTRGYPVGYSIRSQDILENIKISRQDILNE